MELALLLFDGEQRPAGDPPMPDKPAAEHLDAVGLLWAGAKHHLGRAAGFFEGRARSAVPFAWHASTHPVSSAGGVVETVASIGRTVVPVRTTLSPIMQRRGLGRHLDDIEVDLAEFQAGRPPQPQGPSTTASWRLSRVVCAATTNVTTPPSTACGSRCRSTSERRRIPWAATASRSCASSSR